MAREIDMVVYLDEEKLNISSPKTQGQWRISSEVYMI